MEYKKSHRPAAVSATAWCLLILCPASRLAQGAVYSCRPLLVNLGKIGTETSGTVCGSGSENLSRAISQREEAEIFPHC